MTVHLKWEIQRWREKGLGWRKGKVVWLGVWRLGFLLAGARFGWRQRIMGHHYGMVGASNRPQKMGCLCLGDGDISDVGLGLSSG
ncbi:unnamed protein product [Prunus brigantina]